MPSIKAVMTPFPYFIGLQDPLTKAREMMAQHGIHHLPVMDQGELIGVISYRDVLRALDLNVSGSRTVADAPRESIYLVDLSEPLDRVVAHMAEQRLGAALVVKDGRLAGIFTLTDACRSFAESLRQQFPREGGDEAA